MPTPPPERERTIPQAGDHESRLGALEDAMGELRQLARETHAAIVGTPTAAGHGEEIRALKTRVGALERGRNLVTGVAVTALTAVASAWAAFAGGPKPPVHP